MRSIQWAAAGSVLAMVLLSGLLLSGRSDPEASARRMFNEAMTLQQAGKMAEATARYKELVEKYPETQTAVEANKMLLSSKSVGDVVRSVVEAASSALKEIREKQEEALGTALDIFRLEVGRYPTTEEGLQALVRRPPGLRHWNGPYVNSTAAFGAFDYKGPAQELS